MSYLDRIRTCQRFDAANYLVFEVAGTGVGWVHRRFADMLTPFTDVFAIDNRSVRIVPGLSTPISRTNAVDRVLRTLRDRGHVPGWRNEPFPVSASYSGAPLMTIERAAIPLFGVRAYGIHVNGFVRGPQGLRMWIGRRSRSKHIAPGKLDNIVAGGQPFGLSLWENLIKEAAEEADIPCELASAAIPTGAISYCTERDEGLRRDVLFVYDLEIPSEFVPSNTDGEIEYFELWPIHQVIDRIETSDDFKFNCALVVIDFLIRRGFIAPEHPDYLDMISGLHGA
jgi:hypothetical protein